MSKELEVFKTIRNSKGCLVGMLPEEDLDLIEKALKEKETPTETFEQFVGEPSEVIYKKLKALEIIEKNLTLVKLNDGTEFFDLDLWNTKKQKEDFEFVKKVLDLNKENTIEREVIELKGSVRK